LVSTEGVEWYYEDIIASMRRIYSAGVRGFGGGVSGEELLRLVQSFIIPELWHEVVISGNRPDGPFEIMSWIADQRECDVGTALKIMHIIGYDAIDGSSSSSPEARLAAKILENLRRNFYVRSRFSGEYAAGQLLHKMTLEEHLKFFNSMRQEKSRLLGRDIPMTDDGFGIILGVHEATDLDKGDRMADNAFKQHQRAGFLKRSWQYLSRKKV